MSRRAIPNVYSVPAGAPFLDTLADALLEGRLDLPFDARDPAALATATIYLPTRRAARALANVLLRRSGRRALLLPRIVPLGDPAEGEMLDLIAAAADGEATAGSQPIDPLTRQLILARMIQAAARGGALMSSPTLGAAFALAGDLAAIIDALQTEGVPTEDLMKLEAARFDIYWRNTAAFLAIVGEHWQGVLDERGECDPVAWRNALVNRQRERFEAEIAGQTAVGPVIVAGSTGSMRATARLIAAVARAPHGAVVLPNVDRALPADDWRALSQPEAKRRDRCASHPQAQLARLMAEIDAARDIVIELGAPPVALVARRALAHEALALADSTANWRSLSERLRPADIAAAFGAVRIAEAADDRQEAEICAVAIREALEQGSETIALVTPERGIAERVTLELLRWGVTVDDSAGVKLARTPAGSLAALLGDILRRGVDCPALIGLLGHGGVTLGLSPEALARARAALEIGALRGAGPVLSMAELVTLARGVPQRAADYRAPPARARLGPEDHAAALDLAERLAAALGPLTLLPAEGSLTHGAATLREALEALTLGADGEPSAFDGADGQALEKMLGELSIALGDITGGPEDLAGILSTTMAGVAVRRSGEGHPRVMILGLLEARLISADLMILAGLNESIWPPQVTTDPFLNRAMRGELGLSSPERRIGQSAHDFIEMLCAPQVLLTRAAKSGGAPTLASRFWQRLKAVTPEPLWKESLRRGARLAAIAEMLDRPGLYKPALKPRPKPDRALQPRQFSVTEVETLFRDPYAIYARRILTLAPLEEPGFSLDASDRGDLLHGVMERLNAEPGTTAEEIAAALRRIGEEVFKPLRTEPDVEAFWWPRFVGLIPRVAAWEETRRAGASRIAVELRAKATIRLGDGAEVALTARADRIEQLADGRLAILDFKSGAIPTPAQRKAGLAPQLPLEAALARLAAFEPQRRAEAEAMAAARSAQAIGPAEAAEALFVALKPERGARGALSEDPFVPAAQLAETAEEHLEGFRRLVLEFRDGTRAFVPRFAPQFMTYAGDYDQLARVKEWSVAGDGEEGGEA